MGMRCTFHPLSSACCASLPASRGRSLATKHSLCVWGTDYVGDTSLVRKVVHRLRQKIELDPQDPQYVLSQPGFGYYLGAK